MHNPISARNTIDYLNHRLYEPDFISMQFEQYFPIDGISIPFQFGKFKKIDVKRISLLALPFIALDAFAGKCLSFVMQTVKCISNVSNLTKKNLSVLAQCKYAGNIILSIICIAALFFSFKAGMLLTTAVELYTNIANFVKHIKDKEYKEACKDVAYALSNIVYGAIVCFGSLELVVASLLIKGTICLFQASEELLKGNYPEFFAKFAMSMIRFNSSTIGVQNVQKRNFFNKIKKYKDFLQKIQKSREVNSLYDHPLTNLAVKTENGKVTFTDDDGKVYDFGSHFHGLGKGMVKGMNVSIKKEEDYTRIDFKVNHVHRRAIEKELANLKALSSNPKEFKKFLQLNKACTDSISISHTLDQTWLAWGWEFEVGAAIKIGEKAIIEIGTNAELLNSYDMISVKLNDGYNLYDLHESLCTLGLEDALQESTSQDLDRMKLGYLYRAFFPKEAFHMERSDPFFSKSVAEVREAMIANSSGMEEILEKYEDKITFKDILPGKKRVHIEGLSNELAKIGKHQLSCAITGSWGEDFKRLSSILNMGLMSNEMREYGGVTESGLQSNYDHVGANDEVYTQLVTEEWGDYDSSYYSSCGAIRLLIDPKILESITYQYHGDYFGNKIVSNDWWWNSTYEDRPNIEQFIEDECQDPCLDNEVMTKGRIAPEYITGIVVKTQEKADQLIAYMSDHGHYDSDTGTLFGRDIKIHVGNELQLD